MRERTRAREWALLALYASEMRQGADQVGPALDDLMARRFIAPARRPYVRRLIDTIGADRAALDAALQECLTNWRLDRLSVIDRNVLRIAAAEMLRFDDVPERVSIQEALRLAEKYGTVRSPAFVNGVLDALMRRASA